MEPVSRLAGGGADGVGRGVEPFDEGAVQPRLAGVAAGLGHLGDRRPGRRGNQEPGALQPTFVDETRDPAIGGEGAIEGGA
ncbi:hypothetical protein D3C87_1313420 [compost metagenome]